MKRVGLLITVLAAALALPSVSSAQSGLPPSRAQIESARQLARGVERVVAGARNVLHAVRLGGHRLGYAIRRNQIAGLRREANARAAAGRIAGAVRLDRMAVALHEVNQRPFVARHIRFERDGSRVERETTYVGNPRTGTLVASRVRAHWSR